MTPQQFKSRVQTAALVLMSVTSAYLVYYLYRSFRRIWRFTFGEPERWQTHWKVEEGVVIETATRMQFFVIWSVVILLSAVAIVAAILLLNRCRKGYLFDVGTARLIQWVGGLLVVAMVADTIFTAVELAIITRHNLDEVLPVAYRYDPTDLKTMTLAVEL